MKTRTNKEKYNQKSFEDMINAIENSMNYIEQENSQEIFVHIANSMIHHFSNESKNALENGNQKVAENNKRIMQHLEEKRNLFVSRTEKQKNMKEEDFQSHSDKLFTLGRFIRELEKISSMGDSSKFIVKFADKSLGYPNGFCSWRGDYEDLSIKFDTYTPLKTISFEQFLEDTKHCINKTFYGWKGGDFTMDAESRLWCSNPESGTPRGISGVRLERNEVLIETQMFEFGPTIPHEDEINNRINWVPIESKDQ